MPLLGAHMSIAGGLHKAVEAAAALGMETVQIFTHSPSQWAVKPVTPAEKGSLRDGKSLTKNNNQWRAKEITKAEAEQFAGAMKTYGIVKPLSHASYLINLAAEADELWEKSIAGMIVELQRAAMLGIPFVVVHPGAGVKLTEEAAIERVSQAIDRVHKQAGDVESQILLENTAGQGTCLGHRFEQLAAILGGVKHEGRVGVCIDTCHAFAAGYPLGTKAEYEALWAEFDKHLGRNRLQAMHLNDSKKGLGSRVDRHEHIGHGQIGLEPFRMLLKDPRLVNLPMYLETEKGENEDGESFDAVNMRTLSELAGRK